LIALNVLVFVAMLAASPRFPILTNLEMVRWGADFGPLTLNGQWWRMLTSCFLHFGFIHIGMNMFILYQVGVLTEKLFGNVRYLVLYLLAGLGGSVASLFSHPISVSAGASGAVFGVYGGLLGFLLMQRGVVPKRVSLGIGRSAGVFLLYNLVYGLSSPGTDIQAHGGGFVSGLILGCALAAPIFPTGQKHYPLRTLLVGAAGATALYFAFQSLPRPDPQWFHRTSGVRRGKNGMEKRVLYVEDSPAMTLAGMRDRLRPLLIFAPQANDARLLEQVRIVSEYADEAADRDLVTVVVTEDGSLPAGRRLADGDVAEARRRFHMKAGEFRVVLVGKDGGEKLRAGKPIPFSRLRETIDAMPMRQEEMKRHGR
jgi:rhomboid protease GluP